MKILDWRNRERIKITNNIMPNQILNDLKDSDIEYCVSDDLSWLPKNFDIILFKKNFLTEFKAIKCFHACSPTNLQSYFKDGLTGGNHEKNIKIFNNVFTDVPKNYRQKAIEEMGRGDEIQKTYFLCESENLIKRDGNFLIYGSEYLNTLASKLSHQRFSAEDFRERLKGRGIPTIIEVDINFSFLNDYQINNIINSSLSDWGNYYLGNKQLGELSIIVHEVLPASVIVNHWHPHEIHNPYNYGEWYIPKETTCSLCKK